MKNCKYCGTQIEDTAVFCPTCGSSQAQAGGVVNETAAPVKNESYIGWTVLGFFIPIVALILWAMWKDSEPEKAIAAGKGGLIYVSIAYPIVGLILYIVFKDKYRDVAKACGIAAIIGAVVAAALIVFYIVIYVALILSYGMAAVLPALALI